MHQRHGFTLIELSIVLVIIGLIVGGVLTGKDLIRAAEIRSQVAQLDSYKTAVNALRVKYNCMPGDCSYATQFFGARATPSNGDNCAAVSGGSGTCDGNGDGYITGNSLVSPGAYSYYEIWHFWVQLNAANFINETLSASGYNGGSLLSGVGGVNVPLAKTRGNLIYVIHWGSPNSNFYSIPRDRNIFRILKHPHPASNIGVVNPGLSTMDAYAIDQKADDGLPNSGKVASPNTTGLANCNVLNGSRWEYNMSYSGADACDLLIDMGT